PWLFLIPCLAAGVRSPWVFGKREQGLKTPVGAAWGIPKACFWLLMIVPSFLSAALSSVPFLRNPGFHYVLELWPVLAFLALLGFSAQKSPRWIWTWAVLGLLSWDFDPLAQARTRLKVGHPQAALQRLIADLPQDASLMADELAGPTVASRKWVTRFPDAWVIPGGCPDFLLLQRLDAERKTQLEHLQKKCGKTFVPRGESLGAWQLFASP
ncbi:MAG: hypothetical protein ACO3A2_04865, partial [Bdellovibrionia bacterium]